MFGLACSKFGLRFSGTCSRRSKFDPPKFEEFEVRFFDVRSKTTKDRHIYFKPCNSSVSIQKQYGNSHNKFQLFFMK